MPEKITPTPAILLMGPTAAGKTDLALALSKRLPVDIVSVDSALVYRDMDIGTAKPDAKTLALVPHRLIDICSPEEAYSVARFQQDALQEMQQITEVGRIPLLVGGTMLYYRALQQGLAQLPDADESIRAQLVDRIEQQGIQALHQELTQYDPDTAKRLHPNDTQRIMRALEVYLITGKTLTYLQAQQVQYRPPYQFLTLVRAADRNLLHERINQRFMMMLEQGFQQEVEALLDKYKLSQDMASMRSVGYRQMLAYLNDEYDHETMILKAQAATRQLAKRQFTWLKKVPDALWLMDLDQEKTVAETLMILKSRLQLVDLA